MISRAPTGVLLGNVGSPQAPTAKALRGYLREFLSDPRLVDTPRFLWWPLLNFFIVPLRAPRSAALYKKIWTPQGSPLLHIAETLSQKLAQKLESRGHFIVANGMRCGEPSLKSALEKLLLSGCQKIITLPLYPQYSGATTASFFDGVAQAVSTRRLLPELQFIWSYHDHPDYIDALAKKIESYWARHGKPQHIVFSFHGLPERHIAEGDIYLEQCHRTTELLVARLSLRQELWSLCFQSRFGREKWLGPELSQHLQQLPRKGVTSIQIVCPGFALDCLETLEEVAMRGREDFLSAGGKEFHYIPALNSDDDHVAFLEKIILG